MTNKEKTISSKEESGAFFSLLMEVYSRITPQNKKHFWMLVVFMLGFSILTTLTVGSIALFAAAFSAPNNILDLQAVIWIQNYLSFDFLSSQQGILTALSCITIILIAIKNVLESVMHYCIARYGADVEAYFGTILYNGFIHMPYEWHLNKNSADIILALQWRGYIGHSLFSIVLKSLNDAFVVLFLVLTLVVVSPAVSLLVFTLSGITAYLVYSKVHHLQEREAVRCREYDMSINRSMTKGIHGIKDVKVSGQSSFLEEFKRDVFFCASIRGMRSFYGVLPKGLLETIGFAILSCAVIFMLYFTQSSVLEVTAKISLLIVSAWKILPATSRIMVGFINVRNILPYIRSELDYIKEIEDNAVFDNVEQNEQADQLSFQRDIHMRDVSFSYTNREESVLNSIDFKIHKGQTVGIVGYSGAGKSTIIDLIIGLLSPSSGEVCIDGIALNNKTRFAWMRQLSYVSQTPYICDGTVSANVAFGVKESDIDQQRVLEACRMAHLDDVLQQLPNGIDTVIGERGVRLSGGQRQRIAIARSLYTNPDVIIFDEATSSLDSRSENIIKETIASLKGNKTLIIVAHRLQTVEDCDSIVWLENGRIKKKDTPSSVLGEYEKALQ